MKGTDGPKGEESSGQKEAKRENKSIKKRSKGTRSGFELLLDVDETILGDELPEPKGELSHICVL